MLNKIKNALFQVMYTKITLPCIVSTILMIIHGSSTLWKLWEITGYIKLPTITLGIEEGLILSDFICCNMIGIFIQLFEFM